MPEGGVWTSSQYLNARREDDEMGDEVEYNKKVG